MRDSTLAGASLLAFRRLNNAATASTRPDHEPIPPRPYARTSAVPLTPSFAPIHPQDSKSTTRSYAPASLALASSGRIGRIHPRPLLRSCTCNTLASLQATTSHASPPLLPIHAEPDRPSTARRHRRRTMLSLPPPSSRTLSPQAACLNVKKAVRLCELRCPRRRRASVLDPSGTATTP